LTEIFIAATSCDNVDRLTSFLSEAIRKVRGGIAFAHETGDPVVLQLVRMEKGVEAQVLTPKSRASHRIAELKEKLREAKALANAQSERIQISDRLLEALRNRVEELEDQVKVLAPGRLV
jgi:preprotein translocase subunit SecA